MARSWRLWNISPWSTSTGLGYEVELTSGALGALLSGVGSAMRNLHPPRGSRRRTDAVTASAAVMSAIVFRTLIKAVWRGARSLALALLVEHSVCERISPRAVEGNVVRPPRLTKVPGVGKRTAERLMVELKDKLSHVATVVTTLAGARRRPRM